MQSWTSRANDLASLVMVRECERVFKRNGWPERAPWHGHFNEDEQVLYIGYDGDLVPVTELCPDASEDVVHEFEDGFKVVYMKLIMFIDAIDTVLGMEKPQKKLQFDLHTDVPVSTVISTLGKPYRDQVKTCMLEMGLGGNDLDKLDAFFH